MTRDRASGSVIVSGSKYVLTVSDGYATLADADGTPWVETSTRFAVHGAADTDVADALETSSVTNEGGRIVITSRSSRWASKRFVIEPHDDGLAMWGEVTGQGEVGDVVLLGSGDRPSRPFFASVFSPEPVAPPRKMYHPSESTSIDVTSADPPAVGHWIYTPPPFCYAFSRSATADSNALPEGPWLGVGLTTPRGEHNFTAFRYEGTDRGFVLRLTYDGQTHVDGTWQTPKVVFVFGATDPYDAIARHTALLRPADGAPLRSTGTAEWWSRPIFCGWGAQVELARRAAANAAKWWARAPDFCTQANYDGFLETLAGFGLHPGTIVIDDKWMARYGGSEPEERKWPDLRGWIARQHDETRRVLLWWNSWGFEGLPLAMTVRDASGRAVAADPSNPLYQAHLRGVVEEMLSPSGLDADGLKVDFTAATPRGPGHERYGPEWGVELLHLLLQTIHDAAHRSKPDALIETHAANPYFAEVAEMIRLNDMVRLEDPPRDELVVPEMVHRARIARAACPELLIDTDDWPCPNLRMWREYLHAKASLGVPALYYTKHIDVSGEALEASDYAELRAVWRRAGIS